MLQRLPIVLLQVKAAKTSENWLNEDLQIIRTMTDLWYQYQVWNIQD